MCILGRKYQTYNIVLRQNFRMQTNPPQLTEHPFWAKFENPEGDHEMYFNIHSGSFSTNSPSPPEPVHGGILAGMISFHFEFLGLKDELLCFVFQRVNGGKVWPKHYWSVTEAKMPLHIKQGQYDWYELIHCKIRSTSPVKKRFLPHSFVQCKVKWFRCQSSHQIVLGFVWKARFSKHKLYSSSIPFGWDDSLPTAQYIAIPLFFSPKFFKWDFPSWAERITTAQSRCLFSIFWSID